MCEQTVEVLQTSAHNNIVGIWIDRQESLIVHREKHTQYENIGRISVSYPISKPKQCLTFLQIQYIFNEYQVLSIR